MVRNLPLKSLFKNKQTKIPPQKKPKQTKTPKNQTQNQPSKEEKKTQPPPVLELFQDSPLSFAVSVLNRFHCVHV